MRVGKNVIFMRKKNKGKSAKVGDLDCRTLDKSTVDEVGQKSDFDSCF